MSTVVLSERAEPAPAQLVPVRLRYLYVGIAVTVALIVFLGFAPTYWVPMANGTVAEHPVIHLHAALFSVWIMMFLLQAVFAARGQLALHREIGLFGIALAGAMVVSGLLAMVVNLGAAIGTPREGIVRANTALSVGAMVMFSTFIALAISNIKRPERHKRFIVLSMFAILQAAVARIIMLAPAITHSQRVMLGTIVVDVLLLAVIALDARKHNRIHPVYVVGGLFLLTIQFLRRAVLETPVWLDFTNWLASLTA
jgi:hypothetical protein